MKTLLICRTSYYIPHQSPRMGLECHEKPGKNKLLGISRLWKNKPFWPEYSPLLEIYATLEGLF